ncbi:MAG: sigma-70 family RNA polymerase sigma factor [Planctomycetota bacterium]
MSQTTRTTLLDEIRQTHSSDRWNEFFLDYGKLLQRWLIGKNVSSSDAEDIRQETMVTVLQELPKFEHNGRPGAFRLWLKRILTNRMRQVIQKRASRKEVACLDQLVQTLADEHTEISHEFQVEHERFVIEQLLARARNEFTTTRVQLFRELVLEDVPIDQLIEKYQMTRGAIRVQQHRILKWLKKTGAGVVDL